MFRVFLGFMLYYWVFGCFEAYEIWVLYFVIGLRVCLGVLGLGAGFPGLSCTCWFGFFCFSGVVSWVFGFELCKWLIWVGLVIGVIVFAVGVYLVPFDGICWLELCKFL